MELPLLSRTSSHAATATTASFSGRVCGFSKVSVFTVRRRRLRFGDRDANNDNRVLVRYVKACVKSSSERIEKRERAHGGGGGGGGGFSGSAMEVTTFDRSFGDADSPVWEKIDAVVRLSFGIG